MKLKRDNLSENILTRFFEIREDVASDDVPRMTVTGNSELIVSRSRGISEYGSEKITVAAGRFSVIVKGRDLVITSYNSEETVINGFIESVGIS